MFGKKTVRFMINVLYQSSESYIIPTTISMCSLFENNKHTSEIGVYFIDDGITTEDKKHLISLAEKYNRSINIIDGKSISVMLENAGAHKWKGSYTTYLKLFAEQYISSDSILYIDSDTLIVGDLEPLFDIDLSGYACGMVDELIPTEYLDYIGIEDHFNGGIIYLNLDYWRKNNCENYIRDILSNEEYVKYNIYADQAIINQFFKGKIKRIPVKYNYTTTWWFLSDSKLTENIYHSQGKSLPYSHEEFSAAHDNPVILHYTLCTTDRPWKKRNYYPFIKEYNYYKDLIEPWKPIEESMVKQSFARQAYLDLINLFPTCIKRYSGWKGYCYSVNKSMKNRNLFEAKRRVIVTGANGFIGKWLCQALLQKGYEVFAITRNGCGDIRNTFIHYIKYDFQRLTPDTHNSFSFLLKDSAPFDMLIHLAWEGVSSANQNNDQIQLNNSRIACELFKCAEEIKCKKFVFAGSIIAYETAQHCTKNAGRVRGASVYGAGKLAAHCLLKSLASSSAVEYCEAIISNVYGPGEKSPRLVNSSIRKLLKGENIKCSSGLQEYDFIYIEDAIEKIIQVGIVGQNLMSYYIGSSNTKPLKEYLLLVEKLVHDYANNLEGHFEFAKANEIDDSIDFSIFNMNKTEELLEYKNCFNFEQGIRKTIEWIDTDN